MGTVVFGLGRDDGDTIMAWMSAGVRVCLDREESAQRLFQAARAAAHNEVMCSESIIERVVREVPLSLDGRERKHGSVLTDREYEIAELVSRGLTNTQIADHLRVAPSTVKNHMQSILKRLGARGRDEVARVFEVEGRRRAHGDNVGIH